MVLKYVCYLTIVLSCVISEDKKKPNIIFIVADDLGWNDVSYHGSDQIMTPNIDVLAYHGTIIHEYYTDVQGTPSRSALFTGKYPIRIGTQGQSIAAAEDRGLPVSERLLPSYLRNLGYATHLVGKWHCGKSRQQYLPTNRGFDTFYGFLDGSVDYYTYNLIENCNDSTFFGSDLYNNTDPVEDQSGHITEILTDKAVQIIRNHDKSLPLYLHVSHAAPHIGGGLVNLQPPVNTIRANDHIAHSARRTYAGLVTSLDKSIGNIVAALAEREILKNTIIIFVSDNGAPTVGLSQNFGCNLPLRGVKRTPWEGATRVPAIFWYESIPSKIWKGLFHVTDWLPTLVSAAGGNISDPIDGINQWNAMRNGEKSKRNDILITIDDLNGWAAFRENQFKIIIGNVKNETSKYYGKELKENRKEVQSYEIVLLESETAHVFKETLNMPLDIDLIFNRRNNTKVDGLEEEIDKDPCIPTREKGCLYDLNKDPLESRDIWFAVPEVVRQLALRLRIIWSQMTPRGQPTLDLKANPSLRNYIWSPWVENEETMPETPKTPPIFPLEVSRGELQYLVDLNINQFKNRLFLYIQNMSESFVKSVSGLFSV